MIKIIVASDVRLYREGLSVVLSRDGRRQVLAAEPHSHSIMAQISEFGSHILLIDFGMPDAVDIMRHVHSHRPDQKIIVLSVAESSEVITACAQVGVAGYVSREGSVEDLIKAIDSAQCGELACSPRIAAILLQQVSALCHKGVENHSLEKLTPRELQVAELINAGLSNKQIATKLNIAISTAKNHVHNLLEKLSARHRGEAAAMLRQRSDAHVDVSSMRL